MAKIVETIAVMKPEEFTSLYLLLFYLCLFDTFLTNCSRSSLFLGTFS